MTVALVGPTGSGKTATLLALANTISFEVIVADSVQAVRGFDIGSAKPSTAERAALMHHLLDVAAPNERYTAARFAAAADDLVAKRPHTRFVMTAGTGLYVEAFAEGLHGIGELDPVARQTLTADVQADAAAAHARLQALDPATAGRIHANDWRRIVRALEIHQLTGKLPSDVAGQRQPRAALTYLGIWAEGEAYENDLRTRVDRMLAAGWIDEIEALQKSYGPNLPMFEAVGYRQIVDMLGGHMTPAALTEQIYLATRRYAKRQRTWFRRKPVTWFDYCGGSGNGKLLSALKQSLESDQAATLQ